MSSLYHVLQDMFAPGREQIATVAAYADGVATLTLPGGGQMRARGEATVGTKVFVRDQVVLGPAPDLPVVVDVI